MNLKGFGRSRSYQIEVFSQNLPEGIEKTAKLSPDAKRRSRDANWAPPELMFLVLQLHSSWSANFNYTEAPGAFFRT